MSFGNKIWSKIIKVEEGGVRGIWIVTSGGIVKRLSGWWRRGLGLLGWLDVLRPELLHELWYLIMHSVLSKKNGMLDARMDWGSGVGSGSGVRSRHFDVLSLRDEDDRKLRCGEMN